MIRGRPAELAYAIIPIVFGDQPNVCPRGIARSDELADVLSVQRQCDHPDLLRLRGVRRDVTTELPAFASAVVPPLARSPPIGGGGRGPRSDVFLRLDAERGRPGAYWVPFQVQ